MLSHKNLNLPTLSAMEIEKAPPRKGLLNILSYFFVSVGFI